MNRFLITKKSILHLFVTAIFLCLILPVYILFQMKTVDPDNKELVIHLYINRFYPVFIFYLLIIMFYPYVTEKGRELSFLYSRNRVDIPIVLELLFLSILTLSFFLFYNQFIDNDMIFLIKYLIVFFFYLSLSYCILFLFGNMTIMLTLASVVYILVNCAASTDFLVVELISETPDTFYKLFLELKWIILISIISFPCGLVLNKRYHQYDKDIL